MQLLSHAPENLIGRGNNLRVSVPSLCDAPFSKFKNSKIRVNLVPEKVEKVERGTIDDRLIGNEISRDGLICYSGPKRIGIYQPVFPSPFEVISVPCDRGIIRHCRPSADKTLGQV